MKTRFFSALFVLVSAACGLLGTGCSLLGNTKYGSTDVSAAHTYRQTGPSRQATRNPGSRSGASGGTVDTSPVSRLTVNTETVEAADLWDGLHAELKDKAMSLERRPYRDYVTRRAIPLIRGRIDEMLLYQHAQQQMAPDVQKWIDGYVDAEIRRTVSKQFGGRQRRYEKALKAKGETLEAARDRLRREIVIRSFLDHEVKPKIDEPTRGELLDAFRNNTEALASIRRPPRRRMSLIDVRGGPRAASDAQGPANQSADAGRTAARSRIGAAASALAGGEDFAEVARRYSDGIHADEGGAWGWVTRGSVRERFEPAVDTLFQLHAGEVSSVIETDRGFFLVRCDEIDPGFEPDFQTVQPRLARQLFQNAFEREVQKLIVKLRDRAQLQPQNLARFQAAVVEAAMNIRDTSQP